MKKVNYLRLISLLAILSIGLTSSSCNKDDDDDDNVINLSELTGKFWKPIKVECNCSYKGQKYSAEEKCQASDWYYMEFIDGKVIFYLDKGEYFIRRDYNNDYSIIDNKIYYYVNDNYSYGLFDEIKCLTSSKLITHQYENDEKYNDIEDNTVTYEAIDELPYPIKAEN